jgi:hypothetical protein
MADEEKKAAEESKAGGETPQPKARRRRSKRGSDKGEKGGGVMTKVIATVFGAVVAPILVAVVLQWVKGPTAAPTEPPRQTEKKNDDPVLRLVAPNLNDHFYVFQSPDKREEVDPEEFCYEDKPARIVFLQKRAGVLTTKEEYDNYTMHFWFRWREKQWGPYTGKPRRAGLLLQITGPDGAYWNGRYPQCLGVLLGEGETGSVRLMGVPKRIQCTARVEDRMPINNRAAQAVDTWSLVAQSGSLQAVGAGPASYLLGAAHRVFDAGENPDQLRREYVGGDAKGLPIVTGEPPGWDQLILRRGFPPDVTRGKGGLFWEFAAGRTPSRSRSAPAPAPSWSWSSRTSRWGSIPRRAALPSSPRGPNSKSIGSTSPGWTGRPGSPRSAARDVLSGQPVLRYRRPICGGGRIADEEKKPAEEAKASAPAPQPKARKRRSGRGDGKGKKEGGVLTKVIATVFGAVMAPILVALGVKYGGKIFDSPASAPKETPVSTEKKPDDPVVHLLSPNLNNHFYVFQPPDKREEVDPEEFRYEEDPPRIVFLEKKQGVLTTKADYENYTLFLRFRWREKQWGAMPREGRGGRASWYTAPGRTGASGKAATPRVSSCSWARAKRVP